MQRYIHQVWGQPGTAAMTSQRFMAMMTTEDTQPRTFHPPPSLYGPMRCSLETTFRRGSKAKGSTRDCRRFRNSFRASILDWKRMATTMEGTSAMARVNRV